MAWPKGKEHSVETVQKISESLVGHRHSEETKQRISDTLVETRTGELNPNWKGGYRADAYGPRLYVPDHLRAQKDGSVYISRLEAEDALGRHLKDDEVVYHFNEDRFDNRHSNLLICTRSYHGWLHNKMRRY